MHSFICAILLLCASLPMHAQQLQRSVVGSGGARVTTSTSALRGTVGQTSTGRVASGSSKHNIGFWYRSSTGGTTVAVPNREARSDPQLLCRSFLHSSKGLVYLMDRGFIIKLRYNATVLVNKSPFPCERDGDDLSSTITGTVQRQCSRVGGDPFSCHIG
ncbi:MAG: hypothetical protein IPI29_06590 [Ignavibacteria bacterium]|nr:hypothetical protein [Ignavibacteria bacterium]